MGIIQACGSAREKSIDKVDNDQDKKFDFLNVTNLEEEE